MAQVCSFDPRTGLIAEIVGDSTSSDGVRKACQRAHEAGLVLESMPWPERALMLEAIAAQLDKDETSLVDLAERETALGLVRLQGELRRTTRQLRMFASVIREAACFEVTLDHADPSAQPPTPDIRRMLLPVGPVAVFGASNFPFAFSVAGGDTASALAAGCAVVVKVHSAHPALSVRTAELVRQAISGFGVDDGALGLVFGREAGRLLVQDEDVRAVGFTGSESGGRALMDLAAARSAPIPVYAEMGSLNPIVVSPGAAATDAGLSEGICGSVLLGHGQFCTKPGLIFVPKGSEGDELVADMALRLQGASRAFMLSQGIRDAFLSNVAQVTQLEGVEAIVSPVSDEASGSSASAGLAQTTAAFAASEPGVMTECFGPAALVIRYGDLIELKEALGGVPASLTFSLHVTDGEVDFAQSMLSLATHQAGRVIVNGFPTGVAVTWGQHHGGPYPASASALFTSVGATAIRRFLRPVAFQNWPDSWLPEALQEANPLCIPRRVDGVLKLGKFGG